MHFDRRNAFQQSDRWMHRIIRMLKKEVVHMLIDYIKDGPSFFVAKNKKILAFFSYIFSFSSSLSLNILSKWSIKEVKINCKTEKINHFQKEKR
jgi:hypothetical protein